MEDCATGSLEIFSMSGVAEGNSAVPPETYQTAIQAYTHIYTHTHVCVYD